MPDYYLSLLSVRVAVPKRYLPFSCQASCKESSMFMCLVGGTVDDGLRKLGGCSSCVRSCSAWSLHCAVMSRIYVYIRYEISQASLRHVALTRCIPSRHFHGHDLTYDRPFATRVPVPCHLKNSRR